MLTGEIGQKCSIMSKFAATSTRTSTAQAQAQAQEQQSKT
jgi:hypothetical protein